MIKKILKVINSYLKIFRRLYYTKKIKMQCKRFEEPLIINFKSSVSSNTILHKNVNFNGMLIKGGGKVEIGDNFHSGQNCLMITEIHNFDKGKAIPYDDTYILKDIIIDDNVWLGDQVIILGGVTIGEGAIIQAGSVVVKDIPKYSIAGGHPAVVFKYRDIEHYKKLKKECQFM